jgi:hypothetical protein
MVDVKGDHTLMAEAEIVSEILDINSNLCDRSPEKTILLLVAVHRFLEARQTFLINMKRLNLMPL